MLTETEIREIQELSRDADKLSIHIGMPNCVKGTCRSDNPEYHFLMMKFLQEYRKAQIEKF
jgi:hypothetical protein